MPLWVGISWKASGLGASEQTKVRGNYVCCLVIVVILRDLEEQKGRSFLKSSYGGKEKSHKQEELLWGAIKKNPSFFLAYISDPVPIFSKFRFRRHFTTPKIILTFFFCVILPSLSRQTQLHTRQFIYRFQAIKLNLVEYFRFTNCYGKANKKRISWHSET